MYEIIIGRKESDRQKFGTAGAIYLGKQYVRMGQTTSISNKVYMDVTRSHVVFIAGKRGSGKCVTGDTLVTLANGLDIPIKELEGNNEMVLGLNHELKIDAYEKTEFFKREVNELLRVRLRSGREVELTPEHPLLTLNGWLSAKDLVVGSRVATPRKIGYFGDQPLDEREIKLLAYFITEGHTKKTALFSNNDEIVADDFKKSLYFLNKSIKTIQTKNGCLKVSSVDIKRGVLSHSINRDAKGRFGRGSSITHEKTEIRKFLEFYELYGLLAPQKQIPKEIFRLPKEQLALFLNRLFSCDGGVYRPQHNKDYWEICYSSSSEKLARQVQSLLLRFGITSKLRDKKVKFNNKLFNSYEVVLKGKNVITFIREVGFFGEKEKKQWKVLEDMGQLKRNTNIDTIPKEVWEHYRPLNWAKIGKIMGYKTPKALRSSISYAPSRQKLLQIAVTEDNERLKLLAESDIFWDEIVLMEKLEGSFMVYDLCIPNVHNFIANNIIVHNSYTMGVIAEGIYDLPDEIKNNLSVIMLDTMGVYWTMKYPNNKEKELLDRWEIEQRPLPVIIFTPEGYFKTYKEQGIPTDFPFSIKTNEIDGFEWCMMFGLSPNEPVGVLIERVVNEMKEEGRDFDIKEILQEIKNDDRSEKPVRDAAENKYLVAEKWGLFSKKGTLIESIALPGHVTILDVSCYATMAGAEGLRALVIGLVAEKLFLQRMVARKTEEYKSVQQSLHFFEEETIEEKRGPMVWLVVDEAHEFLPREGETPASRPLITVLREGRQPGISLVLATQQPGKIHTDVITQSDIVISHRLTANLDVEALSMLAQSYLREGIDKQINLLPKEEGAAVIFDDTNERIFPIRVRPRSTWHGGESPTAIIAKKKIFEF